MHAVDVLGDPVRRRILELLGDHEHTAGTIVTVIQREFGISQAAVSPHLKVLRERGLAAVRTDGPLRVYAVEPTAWQEIDGWIGRFRGLWDQRLSALATEGARGKHQKKARPR